MSTYCRRSVDFGDGSSCAAIPTHVDSADAALAVIAAARHHPPRPEVLVLVLGPDLRGETIVVVDGAESPDAVIDVVELLAETSAEVGRSPVFVVASVRAAYGPLPGDGDRWLELSETAEANGCDLLEWFVLGDDVAWCPRDLLAEPPRWP
jgi:hypothetical protein